ncbi:MAG: aminotransferase [Gemmatimonadetes bacterium]|nr:aminotransferase [Gemmatimonadota bacterium]
MSNPAGEAQLARWRADTPGTAHRNHLNNAGAALMPGVVLDTMTAHLQLEAEIGGYEAADAKQSEVAQAYGDVAALINAQPHNVALVANATAGFIQALSAFDFEPGDVIVTTRCDYTSYQITYLALAKRLGVVIRHAEDLPEGGVDPESVRTLASDPRCRLVHVSWVPTNSGLVQDAEGVGAVCEELGVPYLVDACQVVGQFPIDVSRLRCDYLSATARKFLRGPRGMGFLYASDRALARGDHPLFVDMRGARWTSQHEYTIAEGARRFEDWEFPYALVLGLGAAARYAAEQGIHATGRRAFALANRLREGLLSMDGVRVLDRGSEPCAIVTAAFAGRDATQLVALMAKRGINVVSSLRWYGLLDFGEKQVDSALRLSPHYYNTEAEVDAALEALGSS